VTDRAKRQRVVFLIFVAALATAAYVGFLGQSPSPPGSVYRPWQIIGVASVDATLAILAAMREMVVPAATVAAVVMFLGCVYTEEFSPNIPDAQGPGSVLAATAVFLGSVITGVTTASLRATVAKRRR
jgi:hypothetical protein